MGTEPRWVTGNKELKREGKNDELKGKAEGRFLLRSCG